MANRVRAHFRRTASGGRTRVQQHGRRGRGRKGLVSAGHAWKMFKRAFKANRRKKRGLAVTLAVLGIGELGAVLTLDGIRLVLMTAAVLAIGAAAIAGSLTGNGV